MIGWALRQWIRRKLQPANDAVRLQVNDLKVKASKGKKKAREVKRKSVRATRHAILPILPGVSKLKLPPSPTPHLLLTNEPPTDATIVLVRNAISKAEDQQHRMRKKMFIRSMGTEAGYWRSVTNYKIEQTSRYIQQHKGVVSPLRRLPAEILQEIFIWVTYPRTHSRWTTNAEIPWALAQVSRSWRVNALALSALWSHLPTMDLGKSDHRSRTKLQVEYLSELLRRSRSAPIDVYIFSLGFTGHTHPVIDLLIRHCERWQVVTIKMNTSSLPRLREIKGRLPHLESLSLYLSGYDDNVPTIDMFEGAPQLRQVDVGGPFIADLTLPFAQLEHYKDKIRMRNSITRVVTAANSLEALTVLELCESSSTPPIPAVTLPALKKLQVKFCCTRPDFLSNLTVPVLEEIKLVSYHDHGNLIPSLITIISNSRTPCMLQTIRFRTQATRTGQLPALLSLTPNLQVLDMPMPPAVDIAALAHQPLVPMLESCEFFINDLVNTLHDAEISEALNAIATLRCEVPSLNSSAISQSESATAAMDAFSSFHLPNELRPMKQFLIHFDRSRWIPAQQATLEGWPATTGSESLRRVKSHLHEELPELESRRPRRVRKLDRRWVERVRDVLGELARFDVEDVRDIYVSEIHLSLKKLSDKRVPSDDRYHFSDLAKKILTSWEPLFHGSLQECRWIMSGDHSMAYVPQNHDVRNSPDALNSLIYGMQDGTSYRAAFWPIYMN